MEFIVTFMLLVAALGVGTYFQTHPKHEDTIDHPFEQFAESVLDSYGIDVDFSSDKKAQQNDDKDEK